MKTITINGTEYPVYATVEDADAYFEAMYNSNWADVTEEDKQKLLVSATRSIDRQEWKGRKIEETQYLQFPRIIERKPTDDNLLMRACCEEALSMYNAGTTTRYNTEGISSVKVQDTQITFKSNSEEQAFYSNAVTELLRPYMYLGVSVLY
jgi:hypothetical protein